MLKIDGFILNLNEFKKYLDSHIDLFISSISWEERCPVGWERLKKENIISKDKLILFYEEVLDTKLEINVNNPEEYFNNLFNLKSQNEKIHLSISDEITG